MKSNDKIKQNSQPRSRITNEIIFIGLVAISVIYLLALMTHSPLENPYSSSITLTEPVINQAGIIGAYLSDFSLSILGYSAYLIPIMFIWWGWRIHKNTGKRPPHRLILLIRFIAFVPLLLSASALLSIEVSDPLKGGGAIAGGYLGYLTHQYFGVLFGSSSLVAYLSIMMVSFSIVSTLSWSEILNLITRILGGLFRGVRLGFLAIIAKITSKKSHRISKKIKPRPAKTVKKTTQTTSANVFKTQSASGLPDLSLLDEVNVNTDGYSKQALEDISRQVEIKLKDFGFDVTTTSVTPGPVVTQFELSLAPGVKVSQIMNLNKDLARALLVESVRIVDVIPGKPVIGLEIPNEVREIIGLKEILASKVFMQSENLLTMGLGKDINGHPVIANLAKMPHLLVAGATGMGKSVGINAIILSVLYKSTPDKVRMIMIDPKIVELACYAGIPHLLTPVITDMNQAASALWWCVNEMERRYLLLSKFNVRNIESFNKKLKIAKEKSQPLLDPSFNPTTEGETAPELERLPLIMLVIDEYADMLGALAQEDRTKAKRVEALIVRLAQKARAAGIHLIIATQRPSVDVITGLIKSNVPTRIAFKVSSKVDSRTILDQGGAEQLLGMGDMLYMTPGISHLTRVHGAFVDDDEIARVVRYLKENSTPNYLEGIFNAHSESADTDVGVNGNKPNSEQLDALYDEAVQIVTSTRRASISSLQRRLRVGYNRAARIIEDMEASGVVSAMNNAGNRQVLAPEPIIDD